MVAETGLEPATSGLWGSLKGKSESFRLRFVLFTAIRSVSFPLFPSSPARFFRVLGQKRVNTESSCFSGSLRYLLRFLRTHPSTIRHPSAAAISAMTTMKPDTITNRVCSWVKVSFRLSTCLAAVTGVRPLSTNCASTSKTSSKPLTW